MSIFSELEERREGASEVFTRMLDGTLQGLRQHPQLAPVFAPPMRRLVAGNSGYGLFYTVEARGIIIHALIHLSRNPETIREKIRRLLGLRCGYLIFASKRSAAGGLSSHTRFPSSSKRHVCFHSMSHQLDSRILSKLRGVCSAVVLLAMERQLRKPEGMR